MKRRLQILFFYVISNANFIIAQSPLDCSTSTVSACSGNPSFHLPQIHPQQVMAL